MARRFHTLAAIAACALSFAAAPAFAGATTYDFAPLSGFSTPQTIDGATFSSPGDPSAFTFGSNGGLFSDLGAVVLSSAGATAELDITFAKPQNVLKLDFGLGDFLASGSSGTDTLTITPNIGAAAVGTGAIFDSDFYPSGTVTLSSATAFSSVSITSPYAITVADVSSVPEPVSLAVLGVGLVGLVGARRRR